jgi:hypothetical protein
MSNSFYMISSCQKHFSFFWLKKWDFFLLKKISVNSNNFLFKIICDGFAPCSPSGPGGEGGLLGVKAGDPGALTYTENSFYIYGKFEWQISSHGQVRANFGTLLSLTHM